MTLFVIIHRHYHVMFVYRSRVIVTYRHPFLSKVGAVVVNGPCYLSCIEHTPEYIYGISTNLASSTTTLYKKEVVVCEV